MSGRPNVGWSNLERSIDRQQLRQKFRKWIHLEHELYLVFPQELDLTAFAAVAEVGLMQEATDLVVADAQARLAS